jgi:crotonobetaine/carnitine-CoA ligase
MSGNWRNGEEQTLVTMLDRQTHRVPADIAVCVLGEDVTYAQLTQRSISMANALTELGVGPGDVVAMLTENRVEQIYLEFAVAMIGAIEVMLNTAHRGEFLAHPLRDCRARVIIFDAHLASHIREVVPGLPNVVHLIALGGDRDPTGGADAFLSRDALFADQDQTLRSRHAPNWRDPCTIVYTSGTTGPAKGAVFSQNYMVNLGKLESSMWWRGDGDAIYACTPMFHLAAKGVGVLSALYRGARCVLDERFSVSGFWQRIREQHCTATILLGSMMVLLARQEPSQDEGIDVIFALPVPPDLQAPLEKRWRCKFESVYGLSEAAPVTMTDVKARLRPGSAGRVNSEFFDVRVFDDNDNELPAGEVGEVVIRPKRAHVMFEGYFNNPEATLRQFRNLWFHSGDLGRFDEEGFFYFVDRKQDYLRRRGENISSFEIEAAIMRHPMVLEASVIGVPSELTEEEVKACVVLRPGRSLSPEELTDHCIASMPYFAVPRYLEFLEDLPRTPSGKVEKYKLRESSMSSAVWDRESAGIVLRASRRGVSPE